MFEIEFSDRMGEKLKSGGRDWNPCMPDTKTNLAYDDKLVLTLDMQVQAMKGDSIATALNTDFFSKTSSSNNITRTRRVDGNGKLKWEDLDDVKIPSKTWDYVVSHTSSSRNRGDQDTSENSTTMSRQGAE